MPLASVSGPCSELGERVAGVTVPGEVLDARRNERPPNRRSDRDEEVAAVDQRRCLAEKGIALCRDWRLACSIHQLVGLKVADGNALAAEVTDEPGGPGRGSDLVDEREIGGTSILRTLDGETELAPVTPEEEEQEVRPGAGGESKAD